MDFSEIRSTLSERFPPWAERIRTLEFREDLRAQPVDNDGRAILYNERLLRYYTPESRCFYAAQQLLHLQLRHEDRRAGRDRRLWKRASDAVVNAMLKAEGFELPENVPLREDAGSLSAEALYGVLLAEQQDDPDAPAPET